MAELPLANPDAIGFVPARLQRAYDLLEHWVRTDKVPAASLCVGRRGRLVELRFFGRQRPEAQAPLGKPGRSGPIHGARIERRGGGIRLKGSGGAELALVAPPPHGASRHT
jgi:hypothetical protein